MKHLWAFACYNCCEVTAYYRTRGGEWRGCIAATPHIYMASADRIGINQWRKQAARKLISFKIVSILPVSPSLP